jgi:hypothetical protein
MRGFLFFVLILLVVSSCNNSGNNQSATEEQPKQKEVVIVNDMENAAGVVPSWHNEITVTKMEAPAKAHSGEFVAKVDKDNLYSYGYGEVLKNINNVAPKKVIVNGWVNCPEYIEGLIIAMDITNNNQSVIWKGNPISNQVRTQNEWHEFTTEFIIDQPITEELYVKIFAYGEGKTAYFDDFKITFEY